MKGKGPKIEPDTVINFNEVEPHTSIWTASEPVFRNLLKLGYKPTEEKRPLSIFTVPQALVTVSKRRKIATHPRHWRESHVRCVAAG